MIDPIPREDVKLPPPVGYVARADYDAALAKITQLRAEIAHREAERKKMSSRIRMQRQECRWMMAWSGATQSTFYKFIPELHALRAEVTQLRKALNPFAGFGYGLEVGRQEKGACGIILYSGEPHIKRADCEEIEASNMPMDGCILGASVSSGAAAVMIPLLQAKHFDEALAAFTQTEPKGEK